MRKEYRALLVDVGSANVGVAIMEGEEGSAPVLSHLKRVALRNLSGRNTNALPSLAVEALKESLADLAGISPAPRVAHVVLAAPWYRSRIKTIKLQSERTLRITYRTVEKVLREYREKHGTEELSDARTLERTVSQLYVNGYPTALGQPLEGKTLAIHLYESEADLSFCTGIEEALRAAFSGITISFHSFLFTAFVVLRDTREAQDFALVDVGGEITDLAVASRGSLSFIGSFPLGSLALLRALAKGGSAANAASRLSLYARGELSAEDGAAFSVLFEKAAATWYTSYQKLLASVSLEMPVPNTTFLIADTEELSWFKSVLARGKTPFRIEPVLVTPDFFRTEIALGKGGVYDAFLSIAALYSSRRTRPLFGA